MECVSINVLSQYFFGCRIQKTPLESSKTTPYLGNDIGGIVKVESVYLR